MDPKAPALSVRDMEQIQKFNLGKVYSDLITRAEFEELLREVSHKADTISQWSREI